MLLGTGRLYKMKGAVKLPYMKSLHAKWKFHDYMKI